MNSTTTRQQSKLRKVRVAAREGRNNTSARTFPTRHQAIGSLVRCLETNPSQKEWTEAVNSVLLGRWPNIMTMASSEQEPALADLVAIVKEARARVRAKLTPEQLLLNPLALEPVSDATPVQLNHHQAAVNSLQEMAIATPDFYAAFPGIQPVTPFEQVPALFRTAIREAKAAGNPHPEETAIIEYALALLDQSGNVNIRTREQKEFYASVVPSLDAKGQIRIAYSPSNVTIH